MKTETFGKTYYATRNYQDYLGRKFDLLAREIAGCVGLTPNHQILDFGCGYGGLVAAFYSAGYQRIHGTDISQWAIEYGHQRYPELKDRLQFYNRDLLRRAHDLTIMLDVLEHMPEYEISSVLKLAREGSGTIVVRIPVSAKEGEPFVLPVSNNDPTHISCHPREWWNAKLTEAGFGMFEPLGAISIYDSPGVMAGVCGVI